MLCLRDGNGGSRNVWHNGIAADMQIEEVSWRIPMRAKQRCSHSTCVAPEKRMHLWENGDPIPLIAQDPFDQPIQSAEDAREINFFRKMW